MAGVTHPIWSIAGLDPGIIALISQKWRRKYRRGSVNMILIALLCAVSGGFTFWIIFESLLIAIPFSLLWTTILVNLYRLVLLTVGNPHIPHSPKYRFPFGSFLFRSVFLIILGLFIVKPIELLIMEPPLRPYLDEYRAEVLSKHEDQVAQFNLEGVEDIFSIGEAASERADQGGFLMARITLLHQHFPNIWFLTVLLLWIYLRPFWSRIRWRKKSEYEMERGKIEFQTIGESYEQFKASYGEVMYRFTGRDDIWEEPYHDMPYKNEPVLYKDHDLLRPGSVYAWGRIYAKENSDETAEVTGHERHIYLVGEFSAKYFGKGIRTSEPGQPTDYDIQFYDLKVVKARYEEDPKLPSVQKANYLAPHRLDKVFIQFNQDPTGYGKPFRESLNHPIVGDLKLEGVIKERKRCFGMVRGKLYAKVHTTVLPGKV